MGCKYFAYTRLPISVIGRLLYLPWNYRKNPTYYTHRISIKSSKTHSEFVAGKLASKSDRIRWCRLINNIHENRVETEVHLIARIPSLWVVKGWGFPRKGNSPGPKIKKMGCSGSTNQSGPRELEPLDFEFWFVGNKTDINSKTRWRLILTQARRTAQSEKDAGNFWEEWGIGRTGTTRPLTLLALLWLETPSLPTPPWRRKRNRVSKRIL